MNDHEKNILQDAFKEIAKRTCIIFNQKNYVPWYHANRWIRKNPYVLIKKSNKYSG